MRYKALVQRILKEMIRDKRTLVLMMIAPLFILTLMHVVFDRETDEQLTVGYRDVPSALVAQFPDTITLKEITTNETAKHFIEQHDVDAVIAASGTTLTVTYENADPTKSKQLAALLPTILMRSAQATMPNASQQPAYTITNQYVYGEEESDFFDTLFPVLIGFFVFFFVFLISGISLLRERTKKTLERLLATPVKRSEIIFGYMTGYGLFAIIQTILIVVYATYILNLTIAGNLLWVFVINLLIAFVALAMGLFVSTFASSEFQMMQFIPLVVVPQIFFAGIIPLDTMAHWVQTIGKFLPLSYAGDALTNVMYKGQDFDAIAVDLAILVLFALIFTIANILGLRKYRKV